MDKKDWAYVLASLSILADVAITIPFWHLESNPLVIHLGQASFVLIKLVLVLGLGIIWYRSRAYTSKIAWGNMYLLIVFHVAIVISNAWYVTRIS